MVYLTPCASAVSATVPAITPDTVVCGEDNAVTLRVISGNLNDATNWKWYIGSCGGTFVDTGTSVTISPLVNTTYYVRGEGGCAAPGNCASGVVTLRTKPADPVIFPVAPICVGDLAHIQMNPFTLGTTPIPDSIVVTSVIMSLAIPDNTEDGVNTSLTMPALPVGSQITGIDVTMSLPHTYPGDMIINLEAPNGAIANLYKYNTGTFTGNNGNLPNAGWIDAVTSSAGDVLYSSVDSPYRYTSGRLFIPDLINDSIAGPNPNIQNPTGFVSAAAAIADLYSTPDGIWTLALADGSPGDLGTLTSWSIKIKYNRFAQIPATPGVWTPGNGTLFTDAAGTIDYDGITPRLDIYAMPAATAIYAVTSSINGCNSEAVNTTVTVNIPAAVTVDIPAAVSVCELGITTFSVTASGTNPAYQWQTENGTGTFADITDGENYAGAATNTLTVKNAPKTWNGFKYVCVISSTAPCSQSVSSDTVVLTVNPTPTVGLNTADNTPTHLLPGMVTSLTVTSSPAGDIYTWLKNGDTLFNASGISYDATIDNQGIYKVSVVDINGCTNTTNTLEIADSFSNRLFIYPNPSQNGQFSVSYYSIKNNILPRVLTIYDSKGALVLKQSYTLFNSYDKMAVDFGRLSKGVYLVNLLDRSGKRLATGKVVVE